MIGLVIAVENSDEFKFLTSLLEKLGVKNTRIFVSSRLMSELDRTKNVSRKA
jgi:hypothetical protein